MAKDNYKYADLATRGNTPANGGISGSSMINTVSSQQALNSIDSRIFTGKGAYVTYAFNVVSGQMQQILPINPKRSALILFCTFGSSDASFVLDQGPASLVLIDPSFINRAFTVNNGGFFKFEVSPENAVTVLAFAGDTRGIILAASEVN